MSFTQDELQAFNDILEEKLTLQRREIECALDQRMQVLKQEMQQHISVVQQGIQLLRQQVTPSLIEAHATYVPAEQTGRGEVEVQTDIGWEDLMDLLGKAIDKRYASMFDFIHKAMRQLEQDMAEGLDSIRAEVARMITPGGEIDSEQSVATRLDQLERIVESMQVVMAANHALLSNRLHHHQHQSPDRAHTQAETSLLRPKEEDK
jgi:Arc/MetJ-type ribon-helix-helix transcriptional regulator